MEHPFTLAWRYVVGVLAVEDVPMAAAQLLVAGWDSPALCDLAGRSRREDADQVRGLFMETMDELRVSVPDEEAAERCLLHHVAARIAEGSLTAAAAACQIWHQTSARTELERGFADAIGVEYYFEYVTAKRPETLRAWEEAARSAAERLADAPRSEDPFPAGALPTDQ
ncbi:hypothetical protein [Actinacidiphila acididurans]|uniref:Uncharacterized protein n=1 Tax=Actinacidiphila acididurans TaxID=2784346 RepID=A0ABS2TK10_9ACTN|nr:hypothetical protein [Actinacidiphila acididurans]MBM9503676.1 hypothetical protein [Actinacidiphila acididurans]